MRTHRLALPLLAAAIVLAGCASDGGVTTIGDDSGSASGSGSASASGVAGACSPVGEDLADDADTTVDIGLEDYAFDPSTLEVDAGVVTFDAANAGGEPHELAFLPGGGEVPFTEDGAPDEDALADAGAFELEAFASGDTCTATYDLAPGTYTLFCIVEAADGETHYEKGMEGTLTVSG